MAQTAQQSATQQAPATGPVGQGWIGSVEIRGPTNEVAATFTVRMPDAEKACQVRILREGDQYALHYADGSTRRFDAYAPAHQAWVESFVQANQAWLGMINAK
jgi:hypothetical protein